MKANGQTTLTIKRTGEFTVQTVPGTPHCGALNGALRIKYSFECKCGVSLDTNGFLFDQLSVDRFFQKMKTVSVSCETMTIDTARALYKLIRRENNQCDIQGMILVLSPEPFAAEMRFEWKK